MAAVAGVLVARSGVARASVQPRDCIDECLVATAREARMVAWADRLGPLEVLGLATGRKAQVRLYTSTGEIDETARRAIEQAVSPGGEHPLSVRLEQLVAKAAYHFGGARVLVISAWREHAGRHSSGEGLDFKLDHVRAGDLAAWLRTLPRVGVGVYTHPRTQYVHLDVREPSYHWVDASPPGITWREAQLRDRTAAKRDAAYRPELDLP
jgi:hypothetical protein